MKKALVLGLGVSGKAASDYLKNQGFFVYEVDKHNENDRELEALLPQIEFLVKSPGISWKHPLIQKAQCEITSEIELAFQKLAKSDKTVLAITGSNGKTTTTLLTAHVLAKFGKKVLACGNVGLPLLSCIDTEAEILVVELSSYQLERLQTRAVDAAVILNITPNHLDRYDSFSDYVQVKLHIEKILKKERELFLGDDVFLSMSKQLTNPKRLPNLEIEEKVARIFSLRYRDGRCSHDLENFRAAFALCQKVGVEEHVFWQEAASFVKPDHRLEFVRTLNGVNYINDSKATSVDAVMKAVDAVSGSQKKMILIAGGVDKGGSYKEWNIQFKNKVKKVLLIGQAKHKILQEIGADLDAEIVDTLPQAIKRATLLAQSGEVVLFSPGCSSYDQFNNFEHRGEVFKNIVKEL